MLIQCHECGNKVSTEASACMSCGAPPIREDKGSGAPSRKKLPPVETSPMPRKVLEAHHSGGSTPRILVNQVEQMQGFPEESVKEVGFARARYNVICPKCKKTFNVSGKYLSRSANFKCLHHDCRYKITDENLCFIPVEGEQVVYRRIKDLFSYEGRISVADLWWSYLLIMPLWLVFVIISAVIEPLKIIMPMLFFSILHPIWIKRYHDHGMRSEWVTIQGIAAFTATLFNLLLPNMLISGKSYPLLGVFHGLAILASVGTGILILFIPSKNKLNRYGPPSSRVKRVWS